MINLSDRSLREAMQIRGVAGCHDELIEAFRARKDELGLSNVTVDNIVPWADGTSDKLLGPAQEKNLGKFSLDVLLKVLALKLVVVVDDLQVKKMAPYWERREIKKIRPPQRISASMLERARAMVLKREQASVAARKGGVARAEKLSRERCVEIARLAALARWKK